MAEHWVDVGAAAELAATPLRWITVNERDIALSFRSGAFGAVSNACNHIGGPLVDLANATRRNEQPHDPHPLARDVNVRPGRCASPASRPPRWMPPTRASPARLLRRAWLHLPAIPLHRPFARLVA
jgi:hypothetical protein